MDALLGNVFAHTPEGVVVLRTARAAPSGAVLVVSDTGDGFDAALLERGNSAGGSTGLGLDIARRTAESSGGHLTVSSSGGAIVEVVLTRP